MAEIVRLGGSAVVGGGTYFFAVQCDKAGIETLGITAVSLCGLYRASGLVQRLIDGIVFNWLGGARDDQAIGNVEEGSLLVKLKCFTDERFMDVWEDYKFEELKKRLQEEFSACNIEVKGLKIDIKNLDDVNETRKKIESRQTMAIAEIPRSSSPVHPPVTGFLTRMADVARFFGGLLQIVVEADDVTMRDLFQNAASIYHIYEVSRSARRVIEGIISGWLGGERDDQAIVEIQRGSLLVKLQCFTNKRFMEVWEDCKYGKLKTRLLEEFSTCNIEVKELKINIKNLQEVDEILRQMEIRREETHPALVETPVTGRKISPRIIVQGGSYYTRINYYKDEYLEGVKKAAKGGYDVLKDGKTAVDAVQEAVHIMEDNEHFNAGRGSCLNNKGQVECDAMIMDGFTMKTGAVVAGRNFRNPVLLCRKVMDETPHCSLCANGALTFAEEIGFPTCRNDELIIGPDCFVNFVRGAFTDASANQITIPPNSGSVTAVAMDAFGHLACATSTGGIPGQKEGRIGDTPLVGCGGYANEFGAAASNGHGEALMKMTLARDVVSNIETGLNAQESAEKSVKRMQDHIRGYGGIIAIDKDGNFGKAFNTKEMIWASVKDNELNYGMDRGECNEC